MDSSGTIWDSMDALNNISVFKNYFDTKPGMQITILDFCKNIMGRVNGSHYQAEIEKVRTITDKEQRDAAKAKNPGSDLFRGRSSNGKTSH